MTMTRIGNLKRDNLKAPRPWRCSRAISFRHSERGSVTVEFALIGALLFTLILGIVEVGRALYVWSLLEEVTRRGARLAAVCPITDLTRVQQLATLEGRVLNNLAPQHLQIVYLDSDGAIIGNPGGNLGDITYVRANIVNYQHRLLVPGLPQPVINSPALSTTLPSESLGITPNGISNVQC